MTDLRHWHGFPSEFTSPPDCCAINFQKQLEGALKEADAARENALRDERRRIVVALTEGIAAWERTATSLVDSPASSTVAASAAAEMRLLLAEAGRA